jgi:hypothetical protein
MSYVLIDLLNKEQFRKEVYTSERGSSTFKIANECPFLVRKRICCETC